MAAASVSFSGSTASSSAFEDYSLYSNLSDEELVQLAIERSLTESHGSQTNSNLNPPNPPATNCSSHNPPHPPATNCSSHNPPNPSATNCSSHNPPNPSATNCSSHNPPNPSATNCSSSNSSNRPATNCSSHNPPCEKPPDMRHFDGTVSHFITGYGRRMVAYRRRDGSLIHVAPELEEEEEPLFEAIRCGDAGRVRQLVNLLGTNLLQPSKPGWLAFHQAAWYGQEACLRVLLTALPGMVNKVTDKGQTALFLAVSRDQMSCAHILLEKGADPDIITKDRETPLYKACERENAAMVALLLNHGAAVNAHCIQGWTALQEAVYRNNVEVCEMLVKAGAKLSPANIYGITPLFTAAQSGRVETLRFLLKHGADVNSQAADGATALYEAVKNGHEEVVELLLSQRADANKPGKTGLLPLHIAAKQETDIMVSMLIPATSTARVRRSGISPLHLAAEYDRDEVLEVLIQAGFDVNAQLSLERSKMYEDRRSTALYFAVINNNMDAVSMLLEAGADPNLDMFNPLLVTVRQGSVEIAATLLRHGANINAYIPTHPTTFPATVLLSMRKLSMLKYLLDNGCDALSCFNCAYGSNPHPATSTSRSGRDDLSYTEKVLSETPGNSCVQFCEIISTSNMSRWAGPIIDVLLDYVGHVTLCSRLMEHLDSYPDWFGIKDKAAPPRPLMQLCRVRIRQLVGTSRLRRLHTLRLPASLLRFLLYQDAIDSYDA